MTHILVALPLILIAVTLYLVPQLTPRYALFGVRINLDFRGSPAARRAIASFRFTIFLGLLLTLSLALFLPGSAAGVLLPPALLITMAVAGWIWQYHRLKPFASEAKAQIAQVELTEDLDRLPGFQWLSILPFVILLAAALYLHFNWSSIPARFATHWNAQGQANGWTERTVHGIYGPLIFGALLNAYLMVVAHTIWHGARRSQFRAPALQVLLAAQFLISLMLCIVMLSPVWKMGAGTEGIAISAAVIGLVGFAIWTAIRANASPGADDDRTPEGFWFGGVFYYNRGDSALAVPRRDGFGYTFNFADLRAWVLVAAPFVIGSASARWLL